MRYFPDVKLRYYIYWSDIKGGTVHGADTTDYIDLAVKLALIRVLYSSVAGHAMITDCIGGHSYHNIKQRFAKQIIEVKWVGMDIKMFHPVEYKWVPYSHEYNAHTDAILSSV